MAEIVLPATSDYLEFTSLDTDIDRGYRLEMTLKEATGVSRYVYLYANGDTSTANYHSQVISVYGTTVSAARSNQAYIAYMNANDESHYDVIVRVAPDGEGSAISKGSYLIAGNTTLGLQDMVWSTNGTLTSSKITSLRIAGPVTGMFAAGSRVRLYRL